MECTIRTSNGGQQRLIEMKVRLIDWLIIVMLIVLQVQISAHFFVDH